MKIFHGTVLIITILFVFVIHFKSFTTPASRSRLVVDKDDNGKFMLEWANCPNRSSDYTALWIYYIISLWEMYCQRPSSAKIENCGYCLLPFHTTVMRPLGYERVYLPFCKVANTLFHTQGGGDVLAFPPTQIAHIYIYIYDRPRQGWMVDATIACLFKRCMLKRLHCSARPISRPPIVASYFKSKQLLSFGFT